MFPDKDIGDVQYQCCILRMVVLYLLKKSELPVKLPKDVDFSHPGNPLEIHEKWKKTKHKKTGKPALRETDTLDTFVDLLGISCVFALHKLSQNHLI